MLGEVRKKMSSVLEPNVRGKGNELVREGGVSQMLRGAHVGQQRSLEASMVIPTATLT